MSEATTHVGQRFEVRKLACDVGPDDLLVLLRRLFEDGSDAAWSLRSSILSSLDIKEV